MAVVRAEQVATVAAADVSDELTVVLNALERALQGDASRADLLDADSACTRAAWKSVQLPSWARTNDAVPYAGTLEGAAQPE
jgi:hypothetical protein